MTKQQEADVEYAVENAVNHYVRKGAPATREEMRQDAWEIALRARQTFNADAGDLRGYLYVAVRRSLGTRISQRLAVVTIHGNVELGRTMQTRVELRDHAIVVGGHDGDEHEQPVEALVERETPEDSLLEKEEQERYTTWRIKFRRNLMRALAGWPKRDTQVVDRIYGLDGRSAERPAQVAEELRVEALEVYRVIDKLKRRLSDDLGLYSLGKRLKEVHTS